MKEKERLKRQLFTLGKNIQSQVKSSNTCINDNIMELERQWELLEAELKSRIDLLKKLSLEMESSALEQTCTYLEDKLEDCENEYENRCAKGTLKDSKEVEKEEEFCQVFYLH